MSGASIFYDVAVSLCPTCLKKVEGKILFEDGRVVMDKTCRDHGRQRVLIGTDVEYYKASRQYDRPSQKPLRHNTPTKFGCPYDCGLCPDHEQHSCIAVVEVTDNCNLTCPTCYAGSGPEHGPHRTLAEIEMMLDAVVANEGQPDVVQISGGEPTMHPDFFEILAMAKRKPIKHLMVNTNGIRIATDVEFAKRLADFMPNFEVYLQFDSLKEAPLRALRGRDLRKVREKALANLNEFGISTTLVVTLQKGLNTDEIGAIIEHAADIRCVRGVTFQPTQVAGRLENFNPETDRLTLTEVRQLILEQTKMFQPDDVIPVPCHPEGIAMAYGIKTPLGVVPLSTFAKPKDILRDAANTINFERDETVKNAFYKIFSASGSPESQAGSLKSLLCCLPEVDVPQLTYENVFRVIVMQFFDAYSFDLRPIKKTCVHIVHKDGRLIPFDTMNLLYRNGKIDELRAQS